MMWQARGGEDGGPGAGVGGESWGSCAPMGGGRGHGTGQCSRCGHRWRADGLGLVCPDGVGFVWAGRRSGWQDDSGCGLGGSKEEATATSA